MSAVRPDQNRPGASSRQLTAAMMLTCAALLATSAPVHADPQQRPASKPDRYDPTLEVPPPRPMPMRKAPSPGNSEPGSPVRDYIYRPPADSGAITNRLVPPSVIRK